MDSYNYHKNVDILFPSKRGRTDAQDRGKDSLADPDGENGGGGIDGNIKQVPVSGLDEVSGSFVRKITLKVGKPKKAARKSFLGRLGEKLKKLYLESKTKYVFYGIIFLSAFLLIGWKIGDIINYKGRVSVDFTKENMQNTDLRLYIDEDPNSYKFGEEKEINGKKVPEILTGPISFVWKPEEFPLGKDLTVSTEMGSGGDWDISLFCSTCSPKEDWHPFYRDKLDDYILINEFPGNLNIYAQKIIPISSKSENPKQWLLENIQSQTTMAILDNAYPVKELVNNETGYTAGQNTEIKSEIRGPHTYYLYLNNELDIEFVKKDLDWYEGSDEVQVYLYDLDGNIAVQKTIPDNILSQTAQVTHKFNFPITSPGIYKLDFKGNTDWTISNLKINTNKIVLTGTVNFIDASSVYFSTNKEITLNAYIWHDTAYQTLAINNIGFGESEYKLGEEQLNINQQIKIYPGDYQIKFNGDLNLGGYFFSFTKEQFFLPFVYNIGNTAKPDIIISKTKQKRINNVNLATYTFSKDEFVKLDNLKNITFKMKNTRLSNRFDKYESYRNQGYKITAQYNQTNLWSKKDGQFDRNKQYNSFNDFIKNNVPEDSSISITTMEKYKYNDFIRTKEPDGFTESDDFIFKQATSLRGNHVFYIYSKGNILLQLTKTDLNWYKGEDNVSVKIIDNGGETVCSKTIKDDGNISDNNISGSVIMDLDCRNLEGGVYSIQVSGELPLDSGQIINDFVISRIQLNSNKFVVDKKIITLEPSVYYQDNKVDAGISLLFWNPKYYQTVKVLSEKGQYLLELKESDINTDKSFTIFKGLNTLVIPKGYLQIKGSSFFYNKENIFQPFSFYFCDDSDQVDYRVMDEQLINTITVNKFIIY